MEVIRFNLEYNIKDKTLFTYDIVLEPIQNQLFKYKVIYHNNNIKTDIGEVSMVDGNLYFDFDWFINEYLKLQVKNVVENEIF